MKKVIGILLVLVVIAGGVFGALFFVKGNNKELENKTLGLYLNYIDATKKYHEGKYKGKNTYDYANVVYEAVIAKAYAEQTKDTLPIYECIVTLISENSGDKSLKNYLVQVTREDFTRVIKRWTEQRTDYAKQFVDNQKYSEEKGRTTRDHDLELKVGFKGLEVGGKVNLGAIMDDNRKTTEAILMTLESLKNDIINKDITEQKLIQKMSNEQYLYALGYYSQYYTPIIKELSVEEVYKKYREIEDTENEKLYREFVKNNSNNIYGGMKEDIVETKTKYDTYLEENNIKKIQSPGLNSINEKMYFINNYKFKIPNYYVHNYYTDFNDYNYSLVKYDNNTSNKKSEIIIMSNKNSSNYLDSSHLSTEMNNGNLLKDIRSILNGAGINELEFDSKVNEIHIPSSYGYLYTFISDKKYGEVLVFVDEKAKGFTYIVFLESIDGQTEYRGEYEKIRETIDAVRFITLQMDNDNYLNSRMTPTEVESELRGFGFTNVTQIPTTEFELGGGVLDKAKNLFEGWKKKNLDGKTDSEVLYQVALKLDDRPEPDPAYQKGEYPEYTEIQIWFFSDDKFEKYKVQKEQEDQEKREEEDRIRNEQYKLENLSSDRNEQEDEYEEGSNYIQMFEEANKKLSSGIICNNEKVVTAISQSSIAEKIGIEKGDILNEVLNSIAGEDEFFGHFRIVSEDREELSANDQFELYKSGNYEYEIVGNKSEVLLIEIKKQKKLKSEEYRYLLDFKDDNYYDDVNLGVILSDSNNNYIVDTVNPNSIAYNAGIKVGDIIIEIDGENYEGSAIHSRYVELREKEGTTQHLKVRRNNDGEEELIDIEINY